MLTISAKINNVIPNERDDNRTVNPPTLIADLNTLTLKCGVNLLLNLLIIIILILVENVRLELTTS